MPLAPSCRIPVKVIPNAPRNEVVGWLGEALKIKLKAPPVEGRANAALCESLAEWLDVPVRGVTLLQGATSRQKVVQVEGMDLATLKSTIAARAKA